MGKSYHSRKYNKNLSSVYFYKLFAIFSLTCSLENKIFLKNMNNKVIKNNEEYYVNKEGLENMDDNNFEDKLYLPVNTDSLMESYKKALSEDLEIPEDKISMAKNEAYNKNKLDDDPIEYCETSVISETLPLCENIPHTSDITKSPVIIKIPVVLTECTAAVSIDASIKLEDNILEIKRIRKHVYLKQCKLAPNSQNDNPNTSILFIDGFIRENVEYTAKKSSGEEISKGNLKHTTVEVPFKCATRVTFKTCPKFKSAIPQDEAEILEPNISICDSCEKNKTIGNGEQSIRLSEFFNEKVFCELISAEIIESDILENGADKDCKSPIEQAFQSITEKATLFLTIELLQNQHVKIP